MTPHGVGEWLAVVPQLLGAGILVFSVGFWAVTGRVEPLFVTAAGGLLVAGQGARALEDLKREPRAPGEVEG